MNKIKIFSFLSSIILFSCNNANFKMTKAEYSNPDTFGKSVILRDKKTKAVTLNIDTKDKWTLYAGTSVESINFNTPVANGVGSGNYPINVSDSVRYYFQLVTGDSKVILAEEHLPMDGGYNFRDLGGIKNNNGKYVKWGKIFRSDDLYNLTDKDLQYLSSIPIISIVDFRSEEEVKKAPDKLPSSVVKYYPCSITPGNLLNTKDFVNKSSEEMNNAMEHMNILLVTDPSCIKKYKEFFALLQNNSQIPLMYHCSAGKDRTGMATALILYALGVDEKVIVENYLQSNYYLADKYATYIHENPNLKPLFEVEADYLMHGINEIKKDHGSVENYLTKILDVDLNKMKELYLYN